MLTPELSVCVLDRDCITACCRCRTVSGPSNRVDQPASRPCPYTSFYVSRDCWCVECMLLHLYVVDHVAMSMVAAATVG
jgi:hypothetical protein